MSMTQRLLDYLSVTHEDPSSSLSKRRRSAGRPISRRCNPRLQVAKSAVTFGFHPRLLRETVLTWKVDGGQPNVDFEQLLGTYVGTSTIGKGNVTGRLTLGGRNISRANDLKGEYRIKLGGTDATAVPGLSASGALLGATSLAGVRFSDGESSGRITRGSVVIDHLTLASDRVAFQASGRIAIRDKRMDIAAVLATGNFQGQSQLISQLGAKTALNYLPIGQINRLVSDRTVVFEMMGPMRDPVIRLLPAETLQANARRFLIQEAVGLIAAESLLFD